MFLIRWLAVGLLALMGWTRAAPLPDPRPEPDDLAIWAEVRQAMELSAVQRMRFRPLVATPERI